MPDAASGKRKKIPVWALPVLALLPLWAYVYQGTLEPPPPTELPPLEAGEVLFARCATCHGSSGQGQGVAPALTGVLETFPDWRDHLVWVTVGSADWPGSTYGDGAPKRGGTMPPFGGSLSQRELAQVVLYERVTFGGLEEGTPEHEELLAVAEGETTLDELGLGPAATAAGIDPEVVPAE